jgi:hypothetical protein
MAKVTGVSAATVQRVWSSRGPETSSGRDVQTFGRQCFEEKLVDVVGLYMNPR